MDVLGLLAGYNFLLVCVCVPVGRGRLSEIQTPSACSVTLIVCLCDCELLSNVNALSISLKWLSMFQHSPPPSYFSGHKIKRSRRYYKKRLLK